MDALSLFGLAAVSFTLLCYAKESGSHWWTFGFAVGCLFGSAYGFPSSIGDMPARKVTVFGPGDVSVQYTVDGGAAGDAWVDLYAYPAGDWTIAETAEDIVKAMAH